MSIGGGATLSLRRGASQALDELAAPGDRVMSADAGAFRYLDGVSPVPA